MAKTKRAMPKSVVTDQTGLRDDGCGVGPADAQYIGGWWLPKEETHFPEVMYKGKGYRERDGRVCYQYHKLEEALRHVKNRRNAVDVGAHIGFWANWLSKEFDFVACFEPINEFSRLLKWNMELENYALFDCALGDVQGGVSMEIDPNFTGGTHIVGEGDIQITTLDAFELDDVDFIKIDVEGFEHNVILGAEDTIKRNKPVMVVEQKGNDQRHYKQPQGAAVRTLESWGMKPIQVISGDYIMGW